MMALEVLMVAMRVLQELMAEPGAVEGPAEMVGQGAQAVRVVD